MPRQTYSLHTFRARQANFTFAFMARCGVKRFNVLPHPRVSIATTPKMLRNNVQ